jgi:hypothetical protein
MARGEGVVSVSHVHKMKLDLTQTRAWQRSTQGEKAWSATSRPIIKNNIITSNIMALVFATTTIRRLCSIARRLHSPWHGASSAAGGARRARAGGAGGSRRARMCDTSPSKSGLGFRVQGSGLGFRVQGSGLGRAIPRPQKARELRTRG